MKLWTRLATLFPAVALALAGSAVLRANGAEFFAAHNEGPVVLYYFGNVKDSQGNVLDKLMITISAKNIGMNFPFRNDAPGHFRSPDVGRAIKGLGKDIDTNQIEVKISKPGYKITKAPKVPNKLGAVQLDLFVLDPDPAAPPAK
jgi:hypothetical protein